MTNARTTKRRLYLALLCLTLVSVAGCLRVEVPDSSAQGSGLPPPDFMQADAPATAVTGATPYPYEFNGIHNWINLDDGKTTLTRQELQGKVVLVDFWTYSCINCIRTLPYTTAWDRDYRDKGLVVVGVHSPEFAFEHELANVQDAVNRYGIKYPVGLDNDFVTWRTYSNNYWPHIYLFDRNGTLVYDHIGEGGDRETEAKIQELLGEEPDGSFTVAPVPQFNRIRTPEIYLGAERARVGYSTALGTHVFDLPFERADDVVYLKGTWTIEPERIVAGKDAALFLRYNSKDIHLVAGGSGVMTPFIDGGESEARTVDGQRLYTLASTEYAEQELYLTVDEGVTLYAFTFG